MTWPLLVLAVFAVIGGVIGASQNLRLAIFARMKRATSFGTKPD